MSVSFRVAQRLTMFVISWLYIAAISGFFSSLFSVDMSRDKAKALLSGNSRGSFVHGYPAIHLFCWALCCMFSSIILHSCSSLMVISFPPVWHVPHLHPPHLGVHSTPRLSSLKKSLTFAVILRISAWWTRRLVLSLMLWWRPPITSPNLFSRSKRWSKELGEMLLSCSQLNSLCVLTMVFLGYLMARLETALAQIWFQWRRFHLISYGFRIRQ